MRHPPVAVREARVVEQVPASDRGAETLPVRLDVALHEDVAEVVRPASLAGEDARRRPGRGLVSEAGRGMVEQLLAREGDAAEVEHRILHRHPHPLPAPGARALDDRGQDRHREVQPGTRVADGGARPDGPSVGLPGDAHHPARRLRDHVEGTEIRVRAVVRESLDLGEDAARVDGPDLVPAEPELLDGAGREVLHHHVRPPDEPAKEPPARLGLEVAGDRALVRVEKDEVERVHVGPLGDREPPGVPPPGLLDLDHVGPVPGQRLGAGRPRLELREIDHGEPG